MKNTKAKNEKKVIDSENQMYFKKYYRTHTYLEHYQQLCNTYKTQNRNNTNSFSGDYYSTFAASKRKRKHGI